MSPISEEELDVMIERERARNFAPLNDWSTISAQLREEGLIREGVRPMMSASNSWWRLAAAGLLIAAGGAVAGRYSASTGADTSVAAMAPAQNATSQTTPVDQASSAVSAAGGTDFKSADEAWAVLNRAGADYQKASAYLAANNPVQSARADSAPVYQNRLAALDQVMKATHSALDQAPNDPVINQYYLATMGAREATRQQLNAVQAVSAKLKGF